MIDPKELRIGNWVYYWNAKNNKRFIKVHRIDEDAINGLIPPLFEPVVLTPEILEKAKLTLKDGGYDEIWNSAGRLEIRINYSYITTCDHLHDYQNLYFALNGTELNIEL